jgi:hypothetical protein
MRKIASLIAWWALMVLLWIAYVGTTNRTEVLAGLAAAAIAVVALEVVRAQGVLNFTVERGRLARSAKAPLLIASDFGVVAWTLARSLARRKPVVGQYLEVPFPAGDPHRAQREWRRAYTTTLRSMAPNTIVVDIDPERNVAQLHTLMPDVRGGREVQ